MPAGADYPLYPKPFNSSSESLHFARMNEGKLRVNSSAVKQIPRRNRVYRGRNPLARLLLLFDCGGDFARKNLIPGENPEKKEEKIC
jgi:hypothetical protein